MNEKELARGLGWFSIGLGVTEIVAGRALGRALGMEKQAWLLRAFGVREIAAGALILTQERPTAGVWARVAGDVLDLAALGSGFREDNPKRANLGLAIGTVAAITALDYWVARRLGEGDSPASDRPGLGVTMRTPDPGAMARSDNPAATTR